MASCQEDWQSTKNTVLERSRHMFNNPFMSDVVLTCEGSDKKFFAHKYVLAISSAVFYAMFYGKLVEKNSVLCLSDSNDESLQEFLRFLYMDECELTTDNSMSVLYLAKKYIVPSLAQKCIQFLEANIAVENVFTVLQHAIHFDEKKLEMECWDMIDLNTSEAVASDVFTDINQATLVQLLKRETLKIEEVDLFPAVLKWSEAECLRKGVERNGKNKRDVLGNAIYQIRFASMNTREFAQSTSESGLLKPEEMVLFYEKISGIERTSEVWNMSEREACLKEETLLRCHRFQEYKYITSGARQDHSIGVSFSKPVKIHGVCFVGRGGTEYDVTLKVCSRTTKGKFSPQVIDYGTLGTSLSQYDVMLPAPVKVKANGAAYINATTISNSQEPVWNNWSGTKGIQTIEISGITVTFFEVPSPAFHTNFTSVENGQFDAIIFSEW